MGVAFSVNYETSRSTKVASEKKNCQSISGPFVRAGTFVIH